MCACAVMMLSALVLLLSGTHCHTHIGLAVDSPYFSALLSVVYVIAVYDIYFYPGVFRVPTPPGKSSKLKLKVLENENPG